MSALYTNIIPLSTMTMTYVFLVHPKIRIFRPSPKIHRDKTDKTRKTGEIRNGLRLAMRQQSQSPESLVYAYVVLKAVNAMLCLCSQIISFAYGSKLL